MKSQFPLNPGGPENLIPVPEVQHVEDEGPWGGGAWRTRFGRNAVGPFHSILRGEAGIMEEVSEVRVDWQVAMAAITSASQGGRGSSASMLEVCDAT